MTLLTLPEVAAYLAVELRTVPLRLGCESASRRPKLIATPLGR